MTGELGQDALWNLYKNTTNARQVSFAEFKANYMNTEVSDETQSVPSAEVQRPPALRAPEPQDAFSWGRQDKGADGWLQRFYEDSQLPF